MNNNIKYKILIADDDESIRDMIVMYLEMKGFELVSAVNGKDAVDKEENTRPDLVILDVEMPVLNGFDACRVIRGKRNGINYIPIIFLSGLLTDTVVITGLEIGADDYIRKPFEPLELLNRIRNLLKMKNFIGQVELLENMISTLEKSIETRDSYTAGHSRRVSNISTLLGKELALSEKEIEILAKSSLLHDIGKIGISDQILNKPGKLTDEEFRFIKEHPVKGEEICKNLRLDPQVLNIIRYHHEKIDGSGYPDGLKGSEINRLVKIITVSDIFDALTTDRPYRPAKSKELAISILKQEAQERKLDIDIVNRLERII